MTDPTTALFTQALGLAPPWVVEKVDFDPTQKRIDFDLGFMRSSRFDCPACQATTQPVHDSVKRTWRHLNFFQYEAYLHASVPRVKCGCCGKVSQVPVPWARPGSGYTLMLEALVLTLARTMPVQAIAQLFHLGDDPLWRILRHHIKKARAQEDFSGVRAVAMDETSRSKGHNYISVFSDLDSGRLLFATPGQDQTTVARFAEDLQAHGGDPNEVDIASLDMSKAFSAGARASLPNAKLCFDPFHVIALANTALDEVRRSEVKFEQVLRGQRWSFLKDPKKWTKKQLGAMHNLQRTSLKTVRAWRLKESLRQIYRAALNEEDARGQLMDWYSWARRCRLEPFKRLATTIIEHLDGILTHFDERYSNGLAEGINSMLQAAKARARARGFRRPENYIVIAYLIAGKLKHLPESPFGTTSCGRAG